jgi:hypothetical protein
MKKVKFEDLKFKPHPALGFNTQATIFFPNGYGASVVTGEFAYSEPGRPFELAVLKKGAGITYDTPITNDVLGRLTGPQVEKILNDIAAL